MLDLSETFIYDAVTHAYNFSGNNYRNERHAESIREMVYQASATVDVPEGWFLTRDAFMKDWTIEEVADQLFLESDTDMATFQPLPLYAFTDGFCANEKAAAVAEQWPDRFDVYATIDPLDEGALSDFEEQVEWFDPTALKVYPSSWGVDSQDWWYMDDPDVAYPVFEKALELGIDHVAVHKAIPFGPVPRDPYDPSDIDAPAENFPEIDFSIIHGGFAFTEETAWQIARFPNVYANLEALGIPMVGNEAVFDEILAEMVKIVGPNAYEQIYWASAAIAFHPQIQLETFRDFEFSDEARKKGLGSKIPQITDEDKEKILGLNYAEKLLGVDVEDVRSRIADDEFSQQTSEAGMADPWTTADVPNEAII